ncbi:MAG: metallophosphatase family protein [Dehalococcoidia bacterium]|nr:metallophosphatase family protein [Dehalococcoidia bacterium]
MRSAILADIHSNAAALTAVLDDIDHRGGVDELWLLGDITGYGPDPHRCIEILRRYKCFGVAGNHDLAVLEKVSLTPFDPDAAAAARWTTRQLSVDDAIWLSRLPERLEREGFTLVHGAPRRPIWEHLGSLSGARENFSAFSTTYCLIGHTHIPTGFKKERDGVSAVLMSESVGLVLGRERMILNPGSVGQPRDGDPRASYAVYNSDAGIFRLHRIPYDIDAVRERMWSAGLPIRLSARLERGE